MRPDKDVTGKYVIDAGHGAPKLKKQSGTISTAGIACPCVIVLETFLFSWLARAKQIRRQDWRNNCTTSMRPFDLDVGSKETWTQVVSWTPRRCMTDTGVNGGLSRLSTCPTCILKPSANRAQLFKH